MAARRRKAKARKPQAEQKFNVQDWLEGKKRREEIAPEIAALRRELDSLKRRLQQRQGGEDLIIRAVQEVLSERPPELTIPPRPPRSKQKKEHRGLLHLTDWQGGKLTPDYSVSVLDDRMRLLADEVGEIVEAARSAAKVERAVVLLGGDMIEGELIFPHQAHEIEMSVFDQALRAVPDIAGRLILELLGIFDKLEVYCVTGNHGRPAPKGAGSHPKTNWDRACYEYLKTCLLGPPWRPRPELADRLSIHVADSFYAIANIWNWGCLVVHGDEIRGGFAGFPWYGCVPDDHEILTRSGWKKVDDLVIGEDVLTFDHQTHENCWDPVLDVSQFEIDDNLYRISRPGGMELLCTRDHSWPVVTAWSDERALLKALQINTSHWIPLHGEFKGRESALSPRHAAILGWVVTDGHGRWTGNHWEAVVYQSERKHLEEIEALLESERRPRPPSHRNRDVYLVPVKLEDARAITRDYRSKEELPSLVGQLSREAADAMFDAMVKAEASKRGRSVRFSQRPGPVAEAFQMLSILVGRTAWSNVDGAGIARSVPRTSAALRPTWGKGLEEVPYRGRVWCPTTRTGTWWVRSPSGMVLPTGNTAKKAWGWIDAIPEPWDYLYFGHFHTYASSVLNHRTFYCGATPESGNIYAQQQLAAAGHPAQRFQLFSEEKGVISDHQLYLEEPGKRLPQRLRPTKWVLPE